MAHPFSLLSHPPSHSSHYWVSAKVFVLWWWCCRFPNSFTSTIFLSNQISMVCIWRHSSVQACECAGTHAHSQGSQKNSKPCLKSLNDFSNCLCSSDCSNIPVPIKWYFVQMENLMTKTQQFLHWAFSQALNGCHEESRSECNFQLFVWCIQQLKMSSTHWNKIVTRKLTNAAFHRIDAIAHKFALVSWAKWHFWKMKFCEPMQKSILS